MELNIFDKFHKTPDGEVVVKLPTRFILTVEEQQEIKDGVENMIINKHLGTQITVFEKILLQLMEESY